MKKIYLLAAFSLALVACDNNDDNPVFSPVVAEITATIGDSGMTRAGDTSWTEGDKIGITTTFGAGMKPSVNILYTTAKGDGVFEGEVIYIYNPMSLSAYYPFSDEVGTARSTIEASTDADYQTKENHPKIDFLYASKTGITTDDPKVKLTFSHQMSKLTLIFVNGSGMEVSKIASYQIDGLKLDGVFDTSTGECAAKSTTNPRALSIVPDEGSVKNEVALPSLILFPQAAEAVTLTITDNDEQTYKCNLTFDNNRIEFGNNYQFTIKVNKSGLTVDQSTISEWVTKEMPPTDANEE